MRQDRSHGEAGQEGGSTGRRIDRWIWCARFMRTREGAADMVRKGHVRLEGRRVTRPGHRLAIGDVLTLALSGRTLVVRVEAFAGRRGQAQDAERLYAVLAPEQQHGLAGPMNSH